MENVDIKPVDQKASNYTGVLVVLVVLVLLGVGLFYVVNSGILGGKPSTGPVPPVTNVSGGTGMPAVVRPDFTYKVKSISPDTIILQGERGDFSLPNDVARVKAYAGITSESPELPLAQLKVGDNVNMEFVPGKSATLFVSQM